MAGLTEELHSPAFPATRVQSQRLAWVCKAKATLLWRSCRKDPAGRTQFFKSHLEAVMTSPCFLYLQTLSAWAVSFWFGCSPPGWMNFSVLKHFLFHIAWTMTDRGWQALITREEEANWQKPNFLERWVLILKLHGRGGEGEGVLRHSCLKSLLSTNLCWALVVLYKSPGGDRKRYASLAQRTYSTAVLDEKIHG